MSRNRIDPQQSIEQSPSCGAGTTEARLLLADAQDLYDHNLFLQAFVRTSVYWDPATRLGDLSIEELIFAIRLATRLGGFRLSRWLAHAAQDRDRSHPHVRYFTSHVLPRKWRLFDDFRAMEANSEIEGGDPETQASWLAFSAVRWASVRDFDRAHSCIDRARSWQKEDAWVWSCESDVLGLEDRWMEALAAAESSWEISPGTPFAARSLAVALLNLRRVQEAAQRTAAAAEDTESYELALLASWHLCALAETCTGEERDRVLGRAQHFVDKLGSLAPLADRECSQLFARARLDIARLGKDRNAIERWVEESRSPFYRKLLANLRKNPEGPCTRLPFRNALQKHSECLPTSIASATAAMGIGIDADAMAADITFGGTAEWAAAEWLEKKGLEVRFFVATPEVASSLIQHGLAFVVTLEYDDSAHAVAVVGLDEAAGTLLIHDPQSFRSSEYLMEALGAGEAPLGPRAMIAVPPEKVFLLDQLLPWADCEAAKARESRNREGFHKGPASARKIVTELVLRQPKHPVARLLIALQNHEDGHVGTALTRFQELLQEFPNSRFTRANLLSCCRSLGNTALMRKTLADVVELGMLPGVRSQQDWIYPPGAYVSEYADLLRVSADSRVKAQSLLHSLLRRHGTSAPAWHALADLLWSQRDTDGALLGYRLASCLEDQSEHYAEAYCRALRHVGREEEALERLAQRVRRFGSSFHGDATWVTWIHALEEGGQPERALAGARDALAARKDSGPLLAFLAPFFARMGQWSDAKDLLVRLERTGNPPLFHQASSAFHAMQGELTPAIMHAEAWLLESPLSMRARNELAGLVAKRDGATAAVLLSRKWLAEYPSHDEIEELHNQQLARSSSSSWRRYSLLLRRVRRNPEDGWAWRELAFLSIHDYELLNEKSQARLRPRILRFLEQCDRTSPEGAGTLRAHAQWSVARGEWSQAVVQWVEAIDRDPANLYSYHQAWDCAARLDHQQRMDNWKRIEAMLLQQPGHLPVAREMLMLVAQRFGVAMAEEVVSRWIKVRPDDPEIIEGQVDLLLNHGHGRTDYQRALTLLLPALERFPFQAGLRFSHATALRNLGKLKEAEEVLNEIARRHPDSSPAHIQLAWVAHRHGDTQQALNGLKTAATHDPQNTRLLEARVEILIDARRYHDAREMIARITQRYPKDVSWRESAIKFLLDCGDHEGAAKTARGGVDEHPQGAYLWLLLGRTLFGLKQFAGQGEVEHCLRRSLKLNAGLFEAADYLAMVLVDQRRHSEAEAIMLCIAKRLSDPSPARGRLAWIHRQIGRKQEALDELNSVVEHAPWYSWGWALLLEWLSEDKSWGKAKSLLAQAPAPLYTNTRIRQRRLEVLHKAGLQQEALDTEWNSLLSDFPEDISLHLVRYDSLRGDGRWLEAAEVLRRIQSVDPDSPHLLARSAELFARDQEKEESISSLMRIMFAEAEPSMWPADYAWKALKNAHYEEDAYQEARSRLERGQCPTAHTVSILARYAMERGQSTKRRVQPFLRSWFPDRGAREALALLTIMGDNPQAREVSRAGIFQCLSDYGYQRLVINYWKKHRAGVEAEVGAWSEAARALIGLNKKRAARRLVATWRERKGVAMWVVANYTLCFSGTGSRTLKEVRSACGDALAGLRHDHCARYLAHREAEACVLLGDSAGFLETCERNRAYFDTRLEDHEWFEARRRYLLADLPTLARLLKDKQLWRYRKNVWSLRWDRWSSNLQTSFSGKRINLRWWWVVWFVFVLLRLLWNT